MMKPKIDRQPDPQMQLFVLVSKSNGVTGIRDRRGNRLHLAWSSLKKIKGFLRRQRAKGLLGEINRALPLKLYELEKLLSKSPDGSDFQVVIDPPRELEDLMIWDSSSFN